MGESEAAEVTPGVRAILHTADLGLEIRAGTLAELFHRAAVGMLALIHEDGWPSAGAPAGEPPKGEAGGEAAGAAAPRELALEAEDAASLLAAWLRELLYLHEVHDFVYGSVAFHRLDERRLRATVRGGAVDAVPTRELKGVTYHELEVVRDEGGWRARVIFDV